ncbi:MAG: signal peptidase II [Eubacteriales bacterium]|nr:signal peptidase II [Eubacteriales bacterium]
MYLIIIALVVIFDQLTKYQIQANMELNTSIPLIDGIFHITYIQNRGAAFNIFSEKTVFLLAIQMIVIAAILIYLIKSRRKGHKVMLLSLSFIAAGGIGNLIDRAANGHVVDFLDLRVWPIFNVADVSVCIGCGLLIIFVLLIEPKLNRKESQIKRYKES